MSKYNNNMSASFRSRVSTALENARKLFDVQRAQPLLADDVQHRYDDKFALAEFATNANILSTFNVWRELGVSDEALREMRAFPSDRSVSFRLQAEESCKFLRKVRIRSMLQV